MLKLYKHLIIFEKTVRLVMFAVLAVYPFGLIPFAVWQGVTGSEWGDQRIPAFAIAGTVILCTFCIWKIVPEKLTGTKTVFFCVLLFSISLSVRLFVISILQAEPFSDFLTCYEYAATGSGDTEFLARYSYLGAYALTLRLFLRVFGASVLNAQILNAVVTSCIPIVLYAAVTKAIGKQKIAAVAGFIYAVCPSVVIYTAVPSCEHFSQFCLALAVCSFAYYCTAEWKSKKRWLLCVTTGILFGGVYVYKSGLAYVIVPSLLMSGFCYECLPSFKTPVNKEAVKKAAVTAAQCVVILFVAALLHSGAS